MPFGLVSLVSFGGCYMEGICKCGGKIRSSEHEVLTTTGANKWIANIDDSNLPIRVEQSVCGACGRQMTTIRSNEGYVILKRG